MSAETQLMTALAELLRQGGLAAFLSISLYVNYKLWHTKDALYDRLIESEKTRADSAEGNVTQMVTEQTKTRLVLERLEQRKNGKTGVGSEPPRKEGP